MGQLGPAMDEWRRAAAVTLMTRLHGMLARVKGKDF